MSDALDQAGCIKHRDTARYITYYEDYQEMSEKNPDKLAAFLRIIEVKTTKKIVAFEVAAEEAIKTGKDVPELNLWLEISYNDFVRWALKTMSRSSFQVADKEAEEMMLVKSRVLKRHLRSDDPTSPLVQYKEYILIIENVQAKINGKELPITGDAFEQYGNVPPVLENIPLLQKTWDMLQKTREGMLQKTGGYVFKNRLENKYISNYSKTSKEKTTTNVSDDTQQRFDSLSQEEIALILAHRNQQATQPSTPSEKPKKPRQSKTVKVEPPKQVELPQIDEPDLSHLSEVESNIYNNLLRKEDQPKYLAWPDDVRNVYNNLLGKYGYAVPVDITPKVDECMKRLRSVKPTIQTFKDIDKRVHQQDQYYPNGKKKPIEKQFYKGRGLKPWDYVREIASLQGQISITQDGRAENKSSGPMSHDEAVQLAADVIEQTKKVGYSKIQATAYHQDGIWKVKVVWEDGSPIPIRSREQWEKTFKENYDDDQNTRKGAQ
jgi:hypothetical protein